MIKSDLGRYYLNMYGGDIDAQAPLECSGFDYDSNSGAGFATVTLSAPEGSGGNYLSGITYPAVTAIISKSV